MSVHSPEGGLIPGELVETPEDVLAEILPEGHHCGPVHTDAASFKRLADAFVRKDAAQAERMPDDKAALNQMHDAYTRLERLGWRNAIYCPKDGTAFDAIEPGSTGIFACFYEGEWPNGHWWMEDGGDLWPSRPTLFRLKATTANAVGTEKPSSASQCTQQSKGTYIRA